MAIDWSMAELLEATPLKKTHCTLPSNYQLPKALREGVESGAHLPMDPSILASLVLWRSCAGKPDSYEHVSVTVLHSSPSHGS